MVEVEESMQRLLEWRSVDVDGIIATSDSIMDAVK